MGTFTKHSDCLLYTSKLKESAAALSAIEYDDLTGLYTKSAFYYHAGILMRYKPDQSYVVIIADVKNFKLINNIYGIRVGDDVLRYRCV